MKTLKFVLQLALLSLTRITLAQTPQQCDVRSVQDIICNYSDWDWEIPYGHPNYCKTWAARPTNDAQGKGILDMAAPWDRPASGLLYKIGFMQDFTKAKGWVLLKKDFGCTNGSVKHPYFILYNRYHGLMRVYFYLNNDSETYNGAVITIENDDSQGVSTAILSGADYFMRTPDEYQNNYNKRKELITYVVKKNNTAQNVWLVGEFRPDFDPNVKDNPFTGNIINISIYGLRDSDVKLKGGIEFTTEAYGFGGTKNDIISNQSGANNFTRFVADAKKKIDFVKDQKLEENLKAVNKEVVSINNKLDARLNMHYFMNPTMNYHTVAKMKSVTKFAAALTDSVSLFGKVFSTIGSTVKIAGPFLGIVGSVVGFLWPDKNETAGAAPVFTPTISKGTITLEGSINTSTTLSSITLQVPGTKHNNFQPITLPYYDNPLGIFNLKNKPKAIKTNYHLKNVSYGSSLDSDKEFSRYYKDGNMYYNDWLSIPNNSFTTSIMGTQRFIKYKIANEVIPVYNKAAGVDLVSVEAALVCEPPKSSPTWQSILRPSGITKKPNSNECYSFATTYSGNNNIPSIVPFSHCDSILTFYFNPLLADISTGKLILTHYDNIDGLDELTVQTPFYDIKCFKNLEINVPDGSKVYVKIKAVLKKSEESLETATPILYVKDYELGIEQEINKNQYDEAVWWNAAPTDGSKGHDTEVHDLTIKNNLPPNPCPRFGEPNTYCDTAQKIAFQAVNSITFSNININKNTVYRSYIEALKPTKQYTIANKWMFLWAGSEIEFSDYTTIEDVRVYINAGQNEYVSCNSTPIATFYDGTPNQYNTNAYRQKFDDDMGNSSEYEGANVVYPNPSDGKVSLIFEAMPSTVKVYNAQMQMLLEVKPTDRFMPLDLSNQADGIYFVQSSVNGNNQIRKIIVQK